MLNLPIINFINSSISNFSFAKKFRQKFPELGVNVVVYKVQPTKGSELIRIDISHLKKEVTTDEVKNAILKRLSDEGKKLKW